eukprot:TRINITY_DN57887_c0_g1_i1.p2 TRINITY_DN57887_c0_g1~~TRINITY_DN57887_c0_g1_i1.p2  ORF type:complete len:148 (-),score=18.54 TRINITY_DN57887_c0_g1_i1:71-514(-)
MENPIMKVKQTEYSVNKKLLEELLGHNAGAGVDGQLHLRDLLVDVLHELDDKVDQLRLVHALRVEVGDQEADVVAADGLAAENHKVLGALHQEPQELLAENHLNLVGLLDADRDPHRVDRRLDQHLLVLVTRDHQRVEMTVTKYPYP